MIPESHIKESEEEKIDRQIGSDSEETARIKEITIDDLDTVSKLGQGAYGVVNLVKCGFNGKMYALKVLDKMRVAKFNKIESVMRERDNLFMVNNHPNIMKLESTF